MLSTLGGGGDGCAGGAAAVGDSGAWLGGVGSTEWRLVTGVIRLGGVGGERRVGAGTMITPLPACESSARRGREKIQSGV